MDKLSPTPYHQQGQFDKVTIANFQFAYLAYLGKITITVLLVFVPFFTFLTTNIAQIQSDHRMNTQNLETIATKIVAIQKDQEYMKKNVIRKLKSMERLQISMESSLAAVDAASAAILAASLRTAVATEASKDLTIEYLPTIAGFDPVLKAIQIGVESSSASTETIAADLAEMSVSNIATSADITALLAASVEYFEVMQPVVAVITGDLSAVVGDYFNPIFQLGGWHIRAIHSTVDVLVKEQPVSVLVGNPVVLPNPYPITVTNPVIPPNPYPVTVTNPSTGTSSNFTISPRFLITKLTPKSLPWRDRILAVIKIFYPSDFSTGLKAVYVTGNFTLGFATFWINQLGQQFNVVIYRYDISVQCQTTCLEHWHVNSTIPPGTPSMQLY